MTTSIHHIIPVFLACLFVSTSPILTAETPSSQWPHAVTYEIFVRSFADSNNDGVGDISGITAKLDYLKDLGIQAIWLTPIHPAPSYHKYDITDYRAIDPEFGTMQDFEHLISEAHSRDIRVFMDLVINHTSDQHPWFQEAVQNPESPHRNFYVWKNSRDIKSTTVARTGPDTDNTQRWHAAKRGDHELFYAYFTGGMPDLNYDNPNVRREIYDIGRFWLEKGVDGFRLDAAMHIYPEDRENDNVAFWKEFRQEMEKTNPNLYLVGEVWTEGDKAAEYLPGLKSVFNFDLAGTILNAIKSGNGSPVANRAAALEQKYSSITPDFVDATFLSNHDQDRVASVLNNPDKTHLAASILLTLPGSPFIYYGEEIGMTGTKPDFFLRQPIPWQKLPDPLRTKVKAPRYLRGANKPSASPRSVAEQSNDPSSLLNHYRSLIHLRNATPALNRGTITPIQDLPAPLVAFSRNHENQHLLVLHNVSSKSVTFSLPDAFKNFTTTLWKSSPKIAPQFPSLTIPPHASLILQP